MDLYEHEAKEFFRHSAFRCQTVQPQAWDSQWRSRCWRAWSPYEAVGIPIKLDESPGSIRRAPPLLGEHTEAILSEIGFSSSEIERMLTSGVAIKGGVRV